MATAKKKATKKAAKKKSAPAKVGWAETMRNALEKKQPAGGFPDQGKPRDSAVKKMPKNAF
jgi:hypothetical protein